MNSKSSLSRSEAVVSRLNQPVWYWSLALLVAGLYLASSVYISSRRLLWYDEIYTAIISRLPDLRTMWRALSGGVDQTPPVYFLITRTFDQLFRHADMGIRVPSALALGAAFIVIFDMTRRLTDGLYGLIAMALLTNSFVIYYGYDARPYAIYFMLAAMCLWLWIATADESVTAAVAFGALFFVGIASHYYFILCLVPFAIRALSQRRIFHPKLIAAAVGVICSLAVLYPQISGSRAAVRAGSVISWAPPTMEALRGVYAEFFPLVAIPLVLIAAGVAIFGGSREQLAPAMKAGERIGWLFLSIPLAAYVLAKLVTHFLYNRYVIGAVPGIVVAVTCLLWRHCRESKVLSLAFLIALAGSGIAHQVYTLSNLAHIPAFGDQQELTRQMLGLQAMVQREGKSHIVVSSNLLFLEAWYYSGHPEQYEYISSDTDWALGRFAALPLVSVDEIVANARQTVLISPSLSLVEELERAGVHSKVRFSQPQHVVYLE